MSKIEENVKKLARVNKVYISNKRYFYGRELVEALGLKNPLDVIRNHCKDARVKLIKTKGGMQNKKILSEEEALYLIQRTRRFSIEERKAYIKCLKLSDHVFVHEHEENSFFQRLEQRIENFSRVQKDLFGNKALENVRMETQYPINNNSGSRYILDCYFPDYNIVVEYDEKYHKTARQSTLDKARDEALHEILGKEKDLTIIRVQAGKDEYYLEYLPQLLDARTVQN